jgi:DNA-binding NarL/FixJ family response regulator
MEALNRHHERLDPGRAPGSTNHNQNGLRVLVCVNSEMEKRGIRTMLEPIPQVVDVQASMDIDDAMDLIRSGRFNVVIVAALPPFDAMEKVASLAAEHHVRTVVLLRSIDAEVASALGGLAVDGFLLEDELTDRSLRDALASLAKGEMAMPGRLARRLLARIRKLERAEAERPFLLTTREQQALVLLAKGMSNKQIARRLGISEHGAKRHVANVLAKLNCPNRTLAVALALRYGLVCTDDTMNVAPY